MKSIVWGSCWFNEKIEDVINFYNKSIESLNKSNYSVKPIIFVAKLNSTKEELELLKKSIKDITIIENHTNIFPNKNYGVCAIVECAKKINNDYVAVVDPDWGVEEFNSFVKNIIEPLIYENKDIIIPDIGDASGRSNLLIGRLAIELFYPEYKDIIVSAFPGSFAAKTDCIYKIVSSDNYRYDWGGEWDIISEAIKNNYNISSSKVNVTNLRHRPNESKVKDSFQIWKAIFQSSEMINRYNNYSKCNIEIEPYDSLSNKIINSNLNIKDMIKLIQEEAENETEKQILYMVLYPISSIMGEKYDYIMENSVMPPYDKKLIKQVSDLALLTLKIVLSNSNITIESIQENIKKLQGGLWSDWNIDNQRIAIEEVLNEINNCNNMF